jgi:SRSO17 transposase
MSDPAVPLLSLPLATSLPLTLTAADVGALLPALTAYQAEFAPFFARREQRAWADLYLRGLLTAEVPRKNVEVLALRLLGAGPAADAHVRALQHFLSEAPWDDTPLLLHHQDLVTESLGEPTGVLIVDGSDVAKQGTHSVGVARQYCGATGKPDNCQAGVYLAYASSRGATLLDRRLYVPAAWFEADHADLWAACDLPASLGFRTRMQLAADMVEGVRTRGVLPARWLTADEAFGQDPTFLDRVAAAGLWYLAEVPSSTPIWPLVEPASGQAQARPQRWVPPQKASRQGPVPRREQLHPASPPKLTVAAVAGALPAAAWQPYRILEGRKGPLVAELAALRVIAVRERLPGPEVWLVLRRQVVEPGEEGEVKYYLSNAPATTEVGEFAWASGMRWPIETCLEESKGEVGLDEYECRSWVGWQHHMTLAILAHHFLVQQQVALNQREGGPCSGLSRRGHAAGSGGRLGGGAGGAVAGARQPDQRGAGAAVGDGGVAVAGARRRGGGGAGGVLPAPQRGGVSLGAQAHAGSA